MPFPAAFSNSFAETCRKRAVGVDGAHTPAFLHREVGTLYERCHLRCRVAEMGFPIAEKVHALRLGHAPDHGRAGGNRGFHLTLPIRSKECGVDVVAIVLALQLTELVWLVEELSRATE